MENELDFLGREITACFKAAVEKMSQAQKQGFNETLNGMGLDLPTVLQKPLKIPCFLLVRVSEMLGVRDGLCSILMAKYLRS